MRPPYSCRHTLHTFRGSPGAPSTIPVAEFACVPPRLFRHTLHTLRGPTGAPPKVPVVEFACAPHIHVGTPSHASCPHWSFAEGPSD
eukprot:2797131-Pyramimonas_sp.AAC.1